MKQSIFFRRWFWLILFLFIVTIITIAFILKCIEWELFLSSIGVAITTYLGILKQKIDDDKIFRELFISFNQRYSDEINDHFNNLLNPSEAIIPLNKLLIIDYFNLCSEEYFWYKKGRIPNDIWKSWEAGILINLTIPQVKELFESETKEKKQRISYYGFAEYITPKIRKNLN